MRRLLQYLEWTLPWGFIPGTQYKVIGKDLVTVDQAATGAESVLRLDRVVFGCFLPGLYLEELSLAAGQRQKQSSL